jgi:dipeptidyl aminopeptidase/acylaminoacyl peptidase
MAEALWAQDKVCELSLYEGEGHGFSRPETIADAVTRIESFLERHV